MILICGHCKNDFNTRKSEQKYCSPECSGEARAVRSATPERKCENCGELILRKRSPSGKLEPRRNFVNRKFCGHSCAMHALNSNHPNKVSCRILDVVEDVEWIIGTDSPENIAKRVGYQDLENLLRALREKGYTKLADRLRLLDAQYAGGR